MIEINAAPDNQSVYCLSVAVAAKMRILGKPALLQKLAGISLIKLLEIEVLDAYSASIRVWRLYRWTVLYDANRTLCM